MNKDKKWDPSYQLFGPPPKEPLSLRNLLFKKVTLSLPLLIFITLLNPVSYWLGISGHLIDQKEVLKVSPPWDHSPYKSYYLVNMVAEIFFPLSTVKSSVKVSLYTHQNELLIPKAYLHPTQHLAHNHFLFSLSKEDVPLILDTHLWPIKVLPYTEEEKGSFYE